MARPSKKCNSCGVASEKSRSPTCMAKIRAWQSERLAAGICRSCNNPREPDRIVCSACALKQAESAKRRRESKPSGVCVQSGCERPVRRVGSYCTACLAVMQEQQATFRDREKAGAVKRYRRRTEVVPRA